VLQIQMGRERPVDPAADWLGRSSIGARPGMSETEAWMAGRGVWLLNTDRALRQDEVQFIDPSGTVLAVATITGLTKCGGYFALEGKLLLGDPRVGQPTTTPHRSRNPVAYFDDAPPRRRQRPR
jgi:hypothetical protein